MNETLKKELEDKILHGPEASYIIINVGDLRELIPKLYNELPKNQGKEKQVFQLSVKKLMEGDKIIPLPELEKILICAALEKTKGNVEKAALEVGMSRRNMYRKILEYNIV